MVTFTHLHVHKLTVNDYHSVFIKCG